jgi:hypothetical protein
MELGIVFLAGFSAGLVTGLTLMVLYQDTR